MPGWLYPVWDTGHLGDAVFDWSAVRHRLRMGARRWTEDLVRPVIGAPAPDMSALDEFGQPWQLDDQRGRAVLAIFHRHSH